MIKYLSIIYFLTVFALSFEGYVKTGFFSNEECIKNGHFRDCSLDSFACGYEGCFKDYEPAQTVKDNFALYVHEDRKYYKIDASKIKRSKLDSFIGENNVTIFGEYNATTNIITIKNIK